MIIDFHMHLFPDAIAPKALAGLAHTCGMVPRGAGTVADTLDILDRCDVDAGVIEHIATRPGQTESVNKFAQQIQSDRLICMGSVYPTDPGAAQWVGRIREMGLHGLKLHPDYQDYRADDRAAYPVYEQAQTLGLPIVFHAGYDPLSPKLIHTTPAMLRRITADFPRLQVVAAHMGGMECRLEALETLCGIPNLYFDTALCAEGFMAPALLQEMIARHGYERVLLGSDCPWHLPENEMRLIDSLSIPTIQKENILGDNAARLLRLAN